MAKRPAKKTSVNALRGLLKAEGPSTADLLRWRREEREREERDIGRTSSTTPKRAARFNAALRAVNKRHRKTLKALADISPEFRKAVKRLVREDAPLLKRLAG